MIDDAIRSGALVSVFPGVYVLPESSRDRDILRAAALAHRPRGAISHTDALDVWGLPTSLGPSVRLTVSGGESSTPDTRTSPFTGATDSWPPRREFWYDAGYGW